MPWTVVGAVRVLRLFGDRSVLEELWENVVGFACMLVLGASRCVLHRTRVWSGYQEVATTSEGWVAYV